MRRGDPHGSVGGGWQRVEVTACQEMVAHLPNLFLSFPLSASLQGLYLYFCQLGGWHIGAGTPVRTVLKLWKYCGPIRGMLLLKPLLQVWTKPSSREHQPSDLLRPRLSSIVHAQDPRVSTEYTPDYLSRVSIMFWENHMALFIRTTLCPVSAQR